MTIIHRRLRTSVDTVMMDTSLMGSSADILFLPPIYRPCGRDIRSRLFGVGDLDGLGRVRKRYHQAGVVAPALQCASQQLVKVLVVGFRADKSGDPGTNAVVQPEASGGAVDVPRVRRRIVSARQGMQVNTKPIPELLAECDGYVL